MPIYMLCSPSSRPLWKERNMLEMFWNDRCVAAVAHLDIAPHAVRLQSWDDGQRDMSAFSLPASPAHFCKQAGLWGHTTQVCSLPQLFSTLREVQHWAKGWGNGESCPQKCTSTQERAPCSPTQTALCFPSKPILPCLTILPPSPNLSSLLLQPSLT